MSEYLSLICPSCGGKTRVANDTDRFICDYCGSEHIFRLPSSALAKQKKRPIAPRPADVTIQKKGDSIRLVRRWFSLQYMALLFFCIAWDAFLIFWYGIAFSTDAPWIMFVFPIAHLAIGVSLTYYTLAGLLNRTTLQIDRQTFSVRHDPIPWPGEVKVPIFELDQFYCQENQTKSSNGSTTHYHLVAVLKDGRMVKLVSNLESPEVAFFLEQQLETLLEIPDRPVAGEIPR